MNIPASLLKQSCSNCKIGASCLSSALDGKDFRSFEDVWLTRKKLSKGDLLFGIGAPSEFLYVVKLGFLKGAVVSSEGKEQVTGFHMAGDHLGLDAVYTRRHTCEVSALEESEVCCIPLEVMRKLTRSCGSFNDRVVRLLGQEIHRQQEVMTMLGSMTADERIAAFLLDLSRRFEERGYSRAEFVLRMTRSEIASYLGLKLETVSRALSKLAERCLIDIKQKHIHIIDIETLKKVAGSQNR